MSYTTATQAMPDLKSWYCMKCGRRIFLGRLPEGTHIEHKCRDCKTVTIISR